MDEHTVYDKTTLTQMFTRTCETSHGRGNRTPKLKRQNPMPNR